MPTPPRRRADRIATPTALLSALCLLLTIVVARPGRLPAQVADDPARQVTLFGVLASPGDRKIDPKLAKIEPQLRKLLPNHGFRLLDVRSKRLTSGKTVGCDLESGFTAEATLLQPTDANGKVQLRCAIRWNDEVQLETVVATPPNQLFFCDKKVDGGNRLLIGVGAR
jgi:hypothetical protein